MQKVVFLGMREEGEQSFKPVSKTSPLKKAQPIPVGCVITVTRRKIDYSTPFTWEVVECHNNTDFVGEILADWEISFEASKSFKVEDWL